MRERILIVDDNKALAKLIAKKMEKNIDMEIVVAHSFEEAKNIIEDNDDFFLALLDLNLPDAPNGEIVDFVLSKNILSIVLTGSMDEETRKLFMHKDIVDYVIKDNMNSISYIFDTINRLSKNRNYKVMVVDDSASERNEIKRILMSQQFKVFAAAHGEEAMSYIEDNPDMKFVLTDYNMPVMDGFELMQNIRQKYDKNSLAVIVLTSNDEDRTGAKFLKNGANDYIKKPFSKEELICRINNTIESMENINAMSKFANTDFLTGVYNRRYFYSFMADYYRNNKDSNFVVAMFDIDNFKSVNDKFGHDIGDIVIQKLAIFLLQEVGSKGIVARFDGEEFCVVLLNTKFDDGVKIMVNTRAKIAACLINIKENVVKFTVSIGVTNGDCATDIDKLISVADQALYVAKNSGKNKVEIL
ncbi:bile resistance regulator [Campylobacter iguaniorum]|uniref:GGDEF domain-containing response regulator n=1 Tax=Campylobacter iguaniorum TaxID=1244531 RepID=UPI0007C8DB3A|nr:diguanylate cyclase [Campylobacter iguaniorum]ANE36202.1 bile resistance regulator [Campylobacter iguaniorum]